MPVVQHTVGGHSLDCDGKSQVGVERMMKSLMEENIQERSGAEAGIVVVDEHPCTGGRHADGGQGSGICWGIGVRGGFQLSGCGRCKVGVGRSLKRGTVSCF